MLVQAGQPGVGQYGVEQMYNPGLPIGGTTIAAQIDDSDAGQLIADGTGQVSGQVSVPTTTATTSQADTITATQANTML